MTRNIIPDFYGNGTKDTIEYPSWWPVPIFPNYKTGTFGEWELKKFNLPLARGYFSGMTVPKNDNYLLMKGNSIWMSITPMEIDSQSMFIAAAKGTVVAGGLGMGWTIYNMAMKPEVDEVTVYEIDEQVIEIFFQTSDFDNWPCKDKINIIRHDVKDPMILDEPVDLLYMDIWQKMNDSKAQPDTLVVCEKISAKRVGWWTMELDYINFMTNQGLSIGSANKETHDAWVASTGLPLVTQDYPEWPHMAEVAATNVVLY